MRLTTKDGTYNVSHLAVFDFVRDNEPVWRHRILPTKPHTTIFWAVLCGDIANVKVIRSHCEEKQTDKTKIGDV